MNSTAAGWLQVGLLVAALVGTQFLLSEIWGPGYERNAPYLRFHMAGLRRKLEARMGRARIPLFPGQRRLCGS